MPLLPPSALARCARTTASTVCSETSSRSAGPPPSASAPVSSAARCRSVIPFPPVLAVLLLAVLFADTTLDRRREKGGGHQGNTPQVPPCRTGPGAAALKTRPVRGAAPNRPPGGTPRTAALAAPAAVRRPWKRARAGALHRTGPLGAPPVDDPGRRSAARSGFQGRRLSRAGTRPALRLPWPQTRPDAGRRPADPTPLGGRNAPTPAAPPRPPGVRPVPGRRPARRRIARLVALLGGRGARPGRHRGARRHPHRAGRAARPRPRRPPARPGGGGGPGRLGRAGTGDRHLPVDPRRPADRARLRARAHRAPLGVGAHRRLRRRPGGGAQGRQRRGGRGDP